MSTMSKTARASMGQQAPKEKKVLTTEAAIQEIRNLRAGRLAVLNVEYIDLLLAAHDGLAKRVFELEHPDLGVATLDVA